MTALAQPSAALPHDGCNGLAEKREFLMQRAWPESPLPQCIETHASLVFLTRDRAYKLKKPVLLPHADMRSLAARAALCAEELRLNHALAGDVYRGLTALVRRPNGSLSLGGAGRVVDWVVEMVRLPEAQMLDKRLVDGPQPRRDEMVDFGQIMIGFYRRQIAPPNAGAQYFKRLTREMATDLRHLAQMRAHLGDSLTDALCQTAPLRLAAMGSTILARGKAGLVFEGHGDLRAEHVCLTRPPLAFDRVEFNHDFRLIDPHDEIAGLGLECRRLGVDWIGPMLSAQLAMAGFASPPPALHTVYLVARCLTQARLAIDHLREPNPRTPAKWGPKARGFLDMARAIIAGDVQTLGPAHPAPRPPPRR
ncbi:hypothetical protein [Roseicyclus sp.]|uniref:hypothetical protein n=1 Tax=Roseicyclus sp. TaxID=1914329 RepID=UPI003F6D3619